MMLVCLFKLISFLNTFSSFVHTVDGGILLGVVRFSSGL